MSGAPDRPAPAVPLAPYRQRPGRPPAREPRRALPPPSPQDWPARRPLLAGLVTLVLLALGFGLWAARAQLDGAVVAPGLIEVALKRQVVQHPEGGVVAAILVTEGARVEAGAPLIRLDGALLETEHRVVEGRYFELLARRARLEAERADAPAMQPAPELLAAASAPQVQALIDGERALFEARRDTMRQSLAQLTRQAEQVGAQIDGIAAQTTALEHQRSLLGRELADAEALLRKGLAQQPRVLSLQREAAGLDGRLGELAAARAEADSHRTEIGIARLRAEAERREAAETELRDLGDRTLELAERRRALAEQIAHLEIRAPVSGIVHELQVTTPRAVVRPAEPLLYLVPQDRPLVVSAQIAASNIDEVRLGQPVQLRFPAFNRRTTPRIDGVLAQIAADVSLDETTRRPVYRAEVTIPEAERAKLGGLTLLPGMPVEVYVQTGARSPLAYLLKPLTDYFARAMRES